MKRLCLVLLFAAANAFAAVPPAEKLLPADTLAFFTVPDWPKTGTNFAHSAFGKLWADPSMKAFKEKFFEKFKADMVEPLEKELGFKFADYTGLAQGQFTIAVTRNGWDGRSEARPGLVWVVDTRGQSAQLRTNLTELRKKWTESGRNMRQEKIRGVDFTTVIVESGELGKSLKKVVPGQAAAPAAADDAKAKPKKVEWVIGQSDSLLIVSDTAKDVEKVLALQSGASVPAIGDQAAFAANAPMLRDASTFLWVNVKMIMSTLAKRPAPEAEEGSLFGAAPTIEKALAALGLGDVNTLAVNATQARDGSLVNVSINVPEAARKGLFMILDVNAKDASPPPFVPADAVKFSRWRIDLQRAWTTVENMLVEISPSFAGVSKLILDTAGKDKDPNFDFRRQLLGNLGDDVIKYEKTPRGQTAADLESPPSVTLIGAKNAEQLASSLKAVTSLFPPQMVKYSEREFLGRTVYAFTLPNALGGNARPLNYAASGGYVAFSSDVASLEEYLRSGEGNVKPLREFPGLSDAAQKVGGMASGYFSFENQSETARAAFETARKNPQAVASLLGGGEGISGVLGMGAAPGAGGEKGGMAKWIDPALLPAFDQVAKYFSFNVSAVGVSPNAITFKLYSPTPPQLRQ
jgi:hypothetical protein